MSVHYCRGCIYFQKNDKSCNYIFIEGHSRGCPPGKDCIRKTVKLKRKRKSQLRISERPNNNSAISNEENERRLAFYRSGLCDKEIAIKIGISRSAIAKWRQARQLPANFDNTHKRIDHQNGKEPVEIT